MNIRLAKALNGISGKAAKQIEEIRFTHPKCLPERKSRYSLLPKQPRAFMLTR